MTALLIDGDIFAYRHAAAAEIVTQWDDDICTLHAHASLARERLASELAGLKEKSGASVVVVAISDRENFRKTLYPEYKATRAKNRKPILLAALREFLLTAYSAYVRPGLEADDVLGILATHSSLVGEKRRIVVSIDKDFRTIPCTLWNDKNDTITEVSLASADRFHLIQTVMGDATDNYPGCPGIGPKKAEVLVDAALASAEPWAVVVAAFEKAGLTADDALLQARLARILRADEYDFATKTPVLWTPDKLQTKPAPKKTGKRKIIHGIR